MEGAAKMKALYFATFFIFSHLWVIACGVSWSPSNVIAFDGINAMGEVDITEQREDGLDGAGENTPQENEDCSDCPYFCPVCGECMYEDDCEE